MQGDEGWQADGNDTRERDHWDRVFAMHHLRIRRIVARRLGDADAVDDVVQDTFLRAYRSRRTVDRSQPIGPRLTTIALRVAADADRRARRERSVAMPVERSSSSDDLVEALTERTAVRAALLSLSTRHRYLLMATAVEGVRRTAIAAHQQLDPAAVRAATMRARRRFKEAYIELTEERLPAAVGAVLFRLRARLQQLEAGFPGLEAAGCLASVATLVMLLPVGPIRPLGETRASTGGVTTTTSSAQGDDGIAAAMGISVAPTTRSVGTWGARPPGNAVDAVTTRGRDARRPAQQHVETPTGTTTATAGRDGRGAVLGFSAQDDEERTTARTYGGVEVTNCDATTSTRLKCFVIDTTAAVLQAAR